jgi:mannan endo-1,4-beta-mannosidase
MRTWLLLAVTLGMTACATQGGSPDGSSGGAAAENPPQPAASPPGAQAPAQPTARVPRPAYNPGDGFFVLNGKLYDPNGIEFRIRGVNRLHFDNASQPGMKRSGANTVRWNIPFSRAVSVNIAQVREESIDLSQVPIVGNWMGTCKQETALLQGMVNSWVAQVADWKKVDRYLIVNIANEWGPPDSTAWRDAYVSAIAALRRAGYTTPILIDSGGCGQDFRDLLDYSTAVFQSDPEKNVVFALHVYGNAQRSLDENWYQQLADLAASAGMVFIIGEFGPGKNIGPSPTSVPPGEVIMAAERAGLGWLAWAWDDNNLPGGRSDDAWFSMTSNGPGQYSQPSDLTLFGREVVLNPVYGLGTLAKPASVFRR